MSPLQMAFNTSAWAWAASSVTGRMDAKGADDAASLWASHVQAYAGRLNLSPEAFMERYGRLSVSGESLVEDGVLNQALASAPPKGWVHSTNPQDVKGLIMKALASMPETKRYIQALCKREAEKQADSNTGKSRITKSRFIKARRGNAGGTWLHPKLAVAFARWCDIDFALWCDEQIEALISGGREWGKARAQSSIGYQVMSEILHTRRLRPHDGNHDRPRRHDGAGKGQRPDLPQGTRVSWEQQNPCLKF